MASESVFCRSLSEPLVTQAVKNLPAEWETRVRSLGQEEPLVTHSSILAWRIP